jgi:transcriptional regulator with XRE-family HTH domain
MASQFGRRLKELREAKGLSQEGLARLANISVSSVSKLEQSGEQDPAWSTVQALARSLGVTCESFSDAQPVASEDKLAAKQETKKPTAKKGKK